MAENKSKLIEPKQSKKHAKISRISSTTTDKNEKPVDIVLSQNIPLYDASEDMLIDSGAKKDMQTKRSKSSNSFYNDDFETSDFVTVFRNKMQAKTDMDLVKSEKRPFGYEGTPYSVWEDACILKAVKEKASFTKAVHSAATDLRRTISGVKSRYNIVGRKLTETQKNYIMQYAIDNPDSSKRLRCVFSKNYREIKKLMPIMSVLVAKQNREETIADSQLSLDKNTNNSPEMTANNNEENPANKTWDVDLSFGKRSENNASNRSASFDKQELLSFANFDQTESLASISIDSNKRKSSSFQLYQDAKAYKIQQNSIARTAVLQHKLKTLMGSEAHQFLDKKTRLLEEVMHFLYKSYAIDKHRVVKLIEISECDVNIGNIRRLLMSSYLSHVAIKKHR